MLVSENCERVSVTHRVRDLGNLTYIDTSPEQKYMTVCFFNAQSVGRSEKCSEIELFERDESIDVLTPTETWLRRQGDEAECADMALATYTIRSFPRSTQGGGVALLLRDRILENATVNTAFPFSHVTFELAQLTLNALMNTHIFCLYRSSPRQKNKLTYALILSEFADILEHSNFLGGELVTGGDNSVRFDRPTDPTTAKVLDLIQLFGLSQAVEFPTHSRGHTLDPLIYREDDQNLRSVIPRHTMSSDYVPVVCYLDIAKPPCCPVFQIVRNLRSIDKSQFRTDVSSMNSSRPPSTVDDFISQPRSVLDIHAPATRREVTQRVYSIVQHCHSRVAYLEEREAAGKAAMAGLGSDGTQVRLQ